MWVAKESVSMNEAILAAVLDSCNAAFAKSDRVLGDVGPRT